MKKLHLFTLAIGLLSCVGAEAQNASGAQPLPKPKPPVRQSAPNPGSSRNPNTPPAPGQANPKAVGLKPGAPAGKLLDSIALSKEPYFTDLQEAAKNPTKVYKLVLSGDNNIPNGLEKYSNLQYLEINGPAPQRPMMPGQRADMPDDVPPPPMPMAPPAIPNGKGSEIGAGLLSLGNLTELHLHNLGIKEIPFEISKLTNLKVLDLNGNPVNKFPESISTIKGLKAFYVNDGMAQTLPASMTSMTNLTILETGINSIPEIKSLRELILNNRNPNLPAGIEKLVNLRKIVILSSMMPNNGISELTSKLPNIKEIAIPNAFIRYEDLMTLSKMPLLEKLEVSGLFSTKSMTRLTGFNTLKSLKIWNIYGQKEDDYREIYMGLVGLPSKPALGIKYRKSCEEFLKGQRDLTLYVNDTKISMESMMSIQPRGLIFGSAFLTIPSELLNLGSLQELDLTKIGGRDFNQLSSSLQKCRMLKKLSIPSDALRFIMPSLSEMKGLEELVIKASSNVGAAPNDGREKGNLYKNLPRTKITYID